jgi:uncharacterized membrane protein YtjA (UPF0391 family)
MDTATTQLQELSGAARRSARIGDILIRAWYAGLSGAIGGIARILFAIEVGAQLAFQSIGLLGRCYV